MMCFNIRGRLIVYSKLCCLEAHPSYLVPIKKARLTPLPISLMKKLQAWPCVPIYGWFWLGWHFKWNLNVYHLMKIRECTWYFSHAMSCCLDNPGLPTIFFAILFIIIFLTFSVFTTKVPLNCMLIWMWPLKL